MRTEPREPVPERFEITLLSTLTHAREYSYAVRREEPDMAPYVKECVTSLTALRDFTQAAVRYPIGVPTELLGMVWMLLEHLKVGNGEGAREAEGQILAFLGFDSVEGYHRSQEGQDERRDH